MTTRCRCTGSHDIRAPAGTAPVSGAPPVSGCPRFTGADGFRDSLPLRDALAGDVLLADGLDGAPLSLPYGAPLPLVAPAHYGHKTIKHIVAIGLLARAPRRPPL